MRKLLLFAGPCTFILCSASARADIPKLINYQGMLTDDSAAPPTERRETTFKIHADSPLVTNAWSVTFKALSWRHGQGVRPDGRSADREQR